VLAFAAASLLGSWLLSATWAWGQVFSYYSIEWQEWSGESCPDKLFPLSIGAEVLAAPPPAPAASERIYGPRGAPPTGENDNRRPAGIGGTP